MTLTPLTENQGGDLYRPEMYLDEDSLLKKINRSKSQTNAVTSTHQKISEALKSLVKKKQEQSRLSEKNSFGADVNARNVLKERRNLKELKRKAEIHIDDNVRIKTIRFGGKYAKGLPEFTHEKVVSIKRNKAGVIYDGGPKIYDNNLKHLEKVDGEQDSKHEDMVATVLYE
jgi:hypothetical protein